MCDGVYVCDIYVHVFACIMREKHSVHSTVVGVHNRAHDVW